MLCRRVASIELGLPREVVFAALTDYGGFARWLPGVSHSQVLAREGDVVHAELIWPMLFQSEKFVLELIASPPESVVYAQTDQGRLRGLSGRWDLTAAPDGAGTILTGDMRLWTGLWDIWRNRRKLARALQASLDAIARRAQVLRDNPCPAGDADSRRKVLEVVKHPDGLEIRLFGEAYWLEKRRGGGRR